MIYFDTEVAASRYLADHAWSEKTPQAVAEELGGLVESLLALPREVVMEGVSGAPPWLAVEFALWRLGQALEKLMVNRKRENLAPLLRAVAEVAEDKRLGKGRQPFVLILGRLAPSTYAQTLIKLVDDENLCGHAIKALRVGKVPGASDRVRKVLGEAQAGWIRAEARKYLAKLS